MADPEVKTTSTGYPMPGDVLDGRYELVQIINAGGMGVIMRARQLTMDRDVAVKLLLPERSTKENTRIRFEREVHLAKQLSHPNTIRLYDYGKHGNFLYLVMELLEGEDLKQLLRSAGPLPLARALEILVQTADAVSEAHQHNIVHRDLKPGNLFIQRLGSNRDFVKVLDFGIAKSLDSEKFDVTSTGEVSGTVAYLSPEIVRGARPDKRADVYALGILFMETITGRKIFEGVTVAETLMNQMQKPPQLPASLANTPLAVVVETALAKDPNARYQDAAELLAALNGVVATIDPSARISEAEIVATYGPVMGGPSSSSSDLVPAPTGITPASTNLGGESRTVRMRTDEELRSQDLLPESERPKLGLWLLGGAALVALGAFASTAFRSEAPPITPTTNSAPIVAVAPDSGSIQMELDFAMVQAEPGRPEPIVAPARDTLGLALGLATDVAQLDAEELAAAAVAAEIRPKTRVSKKTSKRPGKWRNKRDSDKDEPKEAKQVDNLDVFGNAPTKKPPPPLKQTPAELRSAAKKAFIAKDYGTCVTKCKAALAGGETSCHPLLANAYRQLGNVRAACRHYKAAGINHKSCITLQSR